VCTSLEFFGQFLIECGEIDGWQLADALALAEYTNRTIGEMARAEGLRGESAADQWATASAGRIGPSASWRACWPRPPRARRRIAATPRWSYTASASS
jgi:hypothetical protein